MTKKGQAAFCPVRFFVLTFLPLSAQHLFFCGKENLHQQSSCLSLYPDKASLRQDDLSGKIKAHPKSFLHTDFLSPVKSLEYSVLLPGFNANSVISHGNFKKHFILQRAYFHMSALTAVLYCIIQHIEKGLAKPVWIVPKFQIRRKRYLEVQFFSSACACICPRAFSRVLLISFDSFLICIMSCSIVTF